jgi:hypothetical protein
MPTNDELKTQLAESNEHAAMLREENEVLARELGEARAAAAAAVTTPVPAVLRATPWGRPSFGLSEGERADLVQYGTTRDAFTGGTLTATGEGLTPANPEAAERDRKAQSAPAADVDVDPRDIEPGY